MEKNNNKGFTLIELLVVIAIIGILAAVVLASLNTARDQANDAAVKSQLGQMRAEAELYVDESGTGNYSETCTVDSGPYDLYQAALGNSTGSGACNVSTGGGDWAAWVDLENSNQWCVDSTGASREVSGMTTATVCPAS